MVFGKSMIPIKDFLGSALKSVKLDSVAYLAEINSNWQTIVGNQLSRIARPSCITKNTLVIDVFDHAFLEPLEYSKKRIKENVSRKVGKDVITEIRFRYIQKKDKQHK